MSLKKVLTLLVWAAILQLARADKTTELIGQLEAQCSQDSSEAALLLDVDLIQSSYLKFVQIFAQKKGLEAIIQQSYDSFTKELQQAARNKAKRIEVVESHSRRVCGMLTILIDSFN